MSKTVSICITSYNRPRELRRCLESIDASNENEIEIIVSEDFSPKREEIRVQLNEYAKKTKYKFLANYNEQNLGYDRNLAKLISLSSCDYILFCSDDDVFNPGMIDEIINTLNSKKSIPYMYTAYTGHDNKATNRNYKSDFIIKKGEDSIVKYVYDGILFSGLIFNRNLVKKLDAEPFVNQNYFQIYMVMKMLYHYGGFYRAISLIDCIMDGENGYGTTELSGEDKLLADRKSVFSNLQFNKGLINVVKYFDKEEGTDVVTHFGREYSLRSYRGMSRARREGGKKMLKEYWQFLNNVGVKIGFPAHVYYRTLLILGSDVSDCLFELPRKILFKLRGNVD